MTISLNAPASQKMFANLKITNFVVTANHTTPVDVGFVDMQDYLEFGCRTIHVVDGGDGVDDFSIVVNTAADGNGSEAILKAHAIGSLPDAINDSLVLSVTAEEIAAQSGEDGVQYRYISAKVGAENAGDDTAVVYIRTAKHAQLDLTSDDVA